MFYEYTNMWQSFWKNANELSFTCDPWNNQFSSIKSLNVGYAQENKTLYRAGEHVFLKPKTHSATLAN